jgi:thiamine-phosphate pyrophosphorylase
VKLRGLYAITPASGDSALLVEKVVAALEGGIAALQYRNKTAHPEQRSAEATQLRALCRSHGVPFIINDDLQLAIDVEADGVHLGRDDGDLAIARRRLPGKILGASCYRDLALARQAVIAGADYVAFGSVFASATKPAAVRAPLSLFQHDLGVPLCAIGGINLHNAVEVIAAGADLLAVISDLFDAPDVKSRAMQYGELFR